MSSSKEYIVERFKTIDKDWWRFDNDNPALNMAACVLIKQNEKIIELLTKSMENQKNIIDDRFI